MTFKRLTSFAVGGVVLAMLAACGGDDNIIVSCDEPKPYQSATRGKRIEVPEGLDPLDEFKEMPLPESTTPPRPTGARCIEAAPSVLTDP